MDESGVRFPTGPHGSTLNFSMNKKVLFGIIGVVVLAIAYWLISPLWRTVRLDEALPGNENLSASMINDNLESMDATTKEQFQKETEAMKDKEPVILAEANLVARAHEVEGKVKLIDAGGNKIVRFENLKTINGPDLRIYLSADLVADDYVDLGEIRATEGNVNYTVPAGTDTDKYRNVLIWCRVFRVLFSYGQF